MAGAKHVAQQAGIALVYGAASVTFYYWNQQRGPGSQALWQAWLLFGCAWALTSSYFWLRAFSARNTIAVGKSNLLDKVTAVSPLVIFEVDGDGTFTKIQGDYEDEGIVAEDLIGRKLEIFVTLAPSFYQFLLRARAGEQFDGFSFIGQRYFHHHFFPTQIGKDKHLSAGFQCVAVDVTTENQLMARVQLSEQIFSKTTEAIVILDRNRIVSSVNDAFAQITDIPPETVIGKRRGFDVLGSPGFGFYREVLQGLKKSGGWSGEVSLRRHNGELFTANFSISVIRDNEGLVCNYVIFFADLTHMKRTHEELRYLANHDNLTDLPNRRLFLDRLEQGIKRAQRSSTQLAIFFIDLDNFKLINDAHGHYVGDEILKEVGRRLLSAVRQTDTVARLAGDEFTVITENVEDAVEVTSIARKIMACFAEPFDVFEEHLDMSASVGVGIYPDDGEDLVSLLKGADTAMYKAKAEGRNGFYSLTEGKIGYIGKAMFFPSELRLALKRDQMELVYQPLHNLRNGRVVGCEALLRWNHHVRGVIPPADFMALSEGAGITSAIGRWTLDEACGQLQIWRQEHVDLDFVSINIANSQINDPGYSEMVIDALARYKLHPSSLMLEIAESVVLQNLTQACQFMRHLSHVGVQFCIDEFGSTPADYSYLKEVPAGTLKVDQRLLARIRADRGDATLLRALLGIGDILGKNTIAMGVERRNQEELLQEIGCGMAQGFLYAKPMTSASFGKTYMRPVANTFLSRH